MSSSYISSREPFKPDDDDNHEDSEYPEKNLGNRFSNILLQNYVAYPKIQVINETETLDPNTELESSEIKRDTKDKEDVDDGPPELFWNPNNKLSTSGGHHTLDSNTQQVCCSVVEGPSLMEQMIQEGLEAKQLLEKQKMEQNRKESKKKEAFGSLKKGFLSNNNNKKKKSRAVLNETTVDENNNIPVPTFKQQHADIQKDLPILRPNPSSNHPLHLPEVQEQMDQQMNQLLLSDTSQWMTPSLMEHISKNPKLLAAMSNPSFTTVLHAMIQNPKSTTETLKQSQPEMLQLLTEFCGLLGNHFTVLGQEQQQQQDPVKSSKTTPIQESSSTTTSSSSQRISKREQDEIQAILENESLKKLLLDSNMKRVIQECSSVPGKFKMYMQDPKYSESLRKMIDAGLLQIQH